MVYVVVSVVERAIAMRRVGRCVVGAVVTICVTLGFVACSKPFAQGSAPGDAEVDSAGDGTGSVHDGGGVDAVGSDGAIGDAGGGVLCQGAFSPPTLVLEHTTQYRVDSFTLSTDQLEAFVTLTPPGSTTEQRMVYEMHRAHAGDVFTLDTSQPLDLTEVGPTPGAFDVALDADGLTLYFSHRQDTDAGMLAVDIYEANAPMPPRRST